MKLTWTLFNLVVPKFSNSIKMVNRQFPKMARKEICEPGILQKAPPGLGTGWWIPLSPSAQACSRPLTHILLTRSSCQEHMWANSYPILIKRSSKESVYTPIPLLQLSTPLLQRHLQFTMPPTMVYYRTYFGWVMWMTPVDTIYGIINCIEIKVS